MIVEFGSENHIPSSLAHIFRYPIDRPSTLTIMAFFQGWASFSRTRDKKEIDDSGPSLFTSTSSRVRLVLFRCVWFASSCSLGVVRTSLKETLQLSLAGFSSFSSRGVFEDRSEFPAGDLLRGEVCAFAWSLYCCLSIQIRSEHPRTMSSLWASSAMVTRLSSLVIRR